MITPLEEILIERIRTTGPMPFAAFMSLALYHPVYGYYTGGPSRVGWRGQFVTSPELDPAFGELWASGFLEVWRSCGEPETFEIVEVGPGEGSFAAAVLGSVDGSFADALSYRLVERSSTLRERQERLLAGRSNVSWTPSVTEVRRSPHGCVFANEVLDNLPVHLVERRSGVLREVCVGVEENELRFVSLPPSNPELARYLERCGIELPEGHRYEVGVAAESFVDRAAAMFDTGCTIFVDYGADAAELARRPEGSLLAYSGRGIDDRVLDDPGDKDITTHANWTAIAGAARRAGLTPTEPVSQRHVLTELGLRDAHEALRRSYDDAVTSGRGADAVAYLSRRQALGAIADPGGLGALETIVATKGIDPPDFVNAKGTGI